MEKVFIAGHRGMVGSALVRKLSQSGRGDTLITRSKDELDLRDAAAVEAFFAKERPGQVYLPAAKVGGIVANDAYPVDFLRDNLLIAANVIDSAWRNGCGKLLFFGAACIYPKQCPQPIKEEYLLTGPLEPTNEGFAVAKIAGISLCQSYRKQHGFDAITVMPANLYGPGDNFHPNDSHVLPALLRRFHLAKIQNSDSVTIWGTGKPVREFLHVDDLADACLFLMREYSGEKPVNAGSGEEKSTLELAKLVAEVVGFTGRIELDTDKPDGTPRKVLDSSAIRAMGWSPSTPLAKGLSELYEWYKTVERSGELRL